MKGKYLSPEVLAIIEKSAMTESQLYAYERFWDALNTEDVLVQGSYNKGREEKRIDNARKMNSLGVDVSIISQVTGLTA